MVFGVGDPPALEADVHWAVATLAFFWLGELLVASLHEFDPAAQLAWGNASVDSRERPSMVKAHLECQARKFAS